MDTKQRTREQISALADGELQDGQLAETLALLRDTKSKDDWELYHRIGDALRSEEVADVKLSEGFASRLASRLEAEPTIFAPVAVPQKVVASKSRRWALPGFAAAAAMAGFAFVATPQLMVAFNGTPAPVVTEAPRLDSQSASTIVPVATSNAAIPVDADRGEVVLRDPNIDDYLLAHQRLSPSVYSSAQYARPAALPAQPEK